MTQTQQGSEIAVRLPADLAPSLAERVRLLLAEVPTVVAPELVFEVHTRSHRCVMCHQGGKLGGHHGPDGRVQWIHRSCHRRLHRSGRPQIVIPAQRAALAAWRDENPLDVVRIIREQRQGGL